MNAETKYSYEKRIRELKAQNEALRVQNYEFRTACSEIYEGCIDVLKNGSATVAVYWLLGRLRRAWSKPV